MKASQEQGKRRGKGRPRESMRKEGEWKLTTALPPSQPSPRTPLAVRVSGGRPDGSGRVPRRDVTSGLHVTTAWRRCLPHQKKQTQRKRARYGEGATDMTGHGKGHLRHDRLRGKDRGGWRGMWRYSRRQVSRGEHQSPSAGVPSRNPHHPPRAVSPPPFSHLRSGESSDRSPSCTPLRHTCGSGCRGVVVTRQSGGRTVRKAEGGAHQKKKKKGHSK